MAKKKITLIPGDGIGLEIAESVKEVFSAAKVQVEWDEVHAGLNTFEKSGVLLPDEVVKSIKTNKVALKGPTTTPIGSGHRSINVTMRQQFNLYANVRPIKSINGLKCIHDDIDMIIVRENTEDLYKGIEYKVGDDVAHGIKLITRGASERIGRFACEIARKHGKKKVTIVQKANIMKLTDGLFLEAIQNLKGEYSDLEIDDLLVDNTCMQLVKNPQQFEVIVTQNLYGDIISDLCSGLIGGLGVASGANIGEDLAIFEAVHGSAPDIAGQNKANPTALLLSAVTMLTHLNMPNEAANIKASMLKTLGDPSTRTGDIGGKLSTTEFTQAVIKNLS